MSTHNNGMVRASFERESTSKNEPSKAFEVQYNPKNIEFDKQVTWKEHKTIGPQDNAMEFQSLKPAGIKLELFFDTTQSQEDVREAWINKLLELTNADVKAKKRRNKKKNEAKKGQKTRPPIVTFRWGSFEMRGVIDSIKVTYLMFAQSGVPIRAKAIVSLKEWKPETYDGGEANVRDDALLHKHLVTVDPGQTITAVALDADADWREIAEANNIDNPLEQVKAGMKLVVGW